MTRKELVALLESQYGEDDEVFVKYDDDQGECISDVHGIEDVTQTHIVKSRWEEKDDLGGWHEISAKEAFQKSGERVRYVTLETQDITKKCIVVD